MMVYDKLQCLTESTLYRSTHHLYICLVISGYDSYDCICTCALYVYVDMAVRLWIGFTYLMQLSMVYDTVTSLMVMSMVIDCYLWLSMVTYGH